MTRRMTLQARIEDRVMNCGLWLRVRAVAASESESESESR